eukprot:7289544-Pyramimonas_sp.AAC.1
MWPPSQIAELEAELAEARAEQGQLLGRAQQLEAECEELGVLLEQQRKARSPSRSLSDSSRAA